MKTHWFHILLALARGASHGAEIRRRALEQAGGELEIYPAMLYGSLEELCARRWIREVARPDERRRCYELTASGRRALEQETRRLESLTRVARGALSRGAAR